MNKNASLPPGHHLDNYVIDRAIGGGGFSIVYLGHVVDSPIQVIVKEYMPRKMASRGEDGLTVQTTNQRDQERFSRGQRLFFQEASTLATLRHPNIVNVLNFFRANGTVYMVMEYEEGFDLHESIRRHKGSLPETLIRSIFVPLLDGLAHIHSKGLLHLDIKPGNIYLRSGGNPILLDFGAVHQMQQSRQNQTTQVVTPGFSPIEQCTPGGYVGPWTDIYAMGATMRNCLDGHVPPAAEKRRIDDTMRPAVEAFRKTYSQSLLAAIDWAMEVDPLLRPQDAGQMLEALAKEDPPAEDENDTGESMFGRFAGSLPWNKG